MPLSELQKRIAEGLHMTEGEYEHWLNNPDAPEPRAGKCEHCGNPLSRHPMRWETPTLGVLTCSGDEPAAEPRPAGPTPEDEPAEIDAICPNCRLLIFEHEMPKVVALRAIWRTRAADERERGTTLSPRQVDRIAEAYAEEDWDSLDFEALVTSHRTLQASEDEYVALTEKLSGILTRTANALKGEPEPLHEHSWHDLAEKAASLQAALDEATRREEALTAERDELMRAIASAHEDLILDANSNEPSSRVDFATQTLAEAWNKGARAARGGSDER